jgi:hypothetical protein
MLLILYFLRKAGKNLPLIPRYFLHKVCVISQFSTFYVTDSCPEVAKVLKDKAPFKVLSLGASIAKNIMKY